jgi:hypothetical protein
MVQMDRVLQLDSTCEECVRLLRAFERATVIRRIFPCARASRAPTVRETAAELQRIVSSCLAKRAADRFQNMPDLRAALERFSAKPAEPAVSASLGDTLKV